MRRDSLYRARQAQWPRLVLLASLALAPLAAAQSTADAHQKATATPYDWWEFDFDAHHSGFNALEHTLSAANVSGLHKAFQVTLPSTADGAPIYLHQVKTSTGTRDLVFVTTNDGHIIALDAHSGAQIWSHQYAAGSCRINNGSQACYTTSLPVADPWRATVISYGLDGRIHRYLAGYGGEIKAGGWPITTTLKAFDEKGSSALSLAVANKTPYVYMTNGGYPGDNGDYQGHLTTVNLLNGSQHVFNTLCSSRIDVHFVERPGTPDCGQVQSALWGRAGVIYDSTLNKIFVATGNGDYNPTADDWGDSVIALQPQGLPNSNGTPLDTYTPVNYQQLQETDADLGSTLPALLPSLGSGVLANLAVMSGKDALLRLINLANLSGQGGPGHTGGEVSTPIGVPQGGQVLTQPAVWLDPSTNQTWVFVANSNGISALRVVVNGQNQPVLQTVWQNGNGGTSPIIANGVLYYVGGAGIRALDPHTGNVLWSDSQINSIHWESPIVVNGMLYVTDGQSRLTAYSL